MMLDTYHTVETPEGVDLPLATAGPIVRSAAFAIDIMIRLALLTAAGIVLGYFEKVGFGIRMIFAFLLEWFYPVLFEVYRTGATPGKQLMHIQVLHDDGTPIGWSASLIRNLLRFVDFLPVAYVTGLICMTMQPEFKRLGDIAAGTLVVYQPRHKKSLALPNIPALAPPMPLNSDAQRAIVAFSERHATLSDERKLELAHIIFPQNSDGVTTLYRIANWIKGC
jgi:uncharacterized RDD family membrane protein YckC